MKKGSNRLRLIFVVVLITLIITAFGFFSEGLTQLPTQNQFSVTRTVEFDGGSYKVTLTMTPTAATDDVIISDSVSGGVIDQNSINFTNFKNYQTFARSDSTHVQIVLLSPFDAAPNSTIKATYVVRQVTTLPRFSGSWRIPSTSQNGTIAEPMLEPMGPEPLP